MSAVAEPDVLPGRTPAPAVPMTLAETGLGADQVEQLLIKTLYAGEATGLALAERMRLQYSVFEVILERARAERLIEVRGAVGTGGASYRYALTDAGRARASICMSTATSARRRSRWRATSRRCARLRTRAATSIASACARASRTSWCPTRSSSSSVRR
jgi:CRISPR/Cas system-associated endoribonuclease Cas2